MPALTPEFMWDLESRMRFIVETEYNRLTEGANLWYPRVTKMFDSGSLNERVNWILSTGRIEYVGKKGGNMDFEDMVVLSKEWTHDAANRGLKINRFDLEDLDGNGVDIAKAWSTQMGQFMGYFPQQAVSDAILAGESADALAYDNVQFFSSPTSGGGHPYNPMRASVGKYYNLLSGAASGSFPGACPIDDSVTLDVAFQNLSSAFAYIRGIKMPNGVTPRFLRQSFILCPPALTTRLHQLTDAKILVEAGTGGAGTGDIEGVIKAWGLGVPIEVPEFAADPTSYYIATQTTMESQLGAIGFSEREAFRITYYTGAGGGSGVNADLDRADELEWHVKGRSVATYGHPFALIKVKAA